MTIYPDTYPPSHLDKQHKKKRIRLSGFPGRRVENAERKLGEKYNRMVDGAIDVEVPVAQSPKSIQTFQMTHRRFFTDLRRSTFDTLNEKLTATREYSAKIPIFRHFSLFRSAPD